MSLFRWRMIFAVAALISSSALAEETRSDLAGLSTDALFALVLENPDDPEINLAFARAAESDGDLRHAMAAYERAYAAAPDDRAAFGAFERMRTRLAPAVTSVVLSAGSAFRSNVRQNPGSFDQPSDVTLEFGANVRDERTVADTRLRSLGSFGARLHVEEDDLNQVRFGGWTGPVFALSPNVSAHAAAGGAAAWFDGDFLYGEASGRGELSVVLGAVPQTLSLYAGYREVNESGDDSLGDGYFIELEGALSRVNNVSLGDRLFLQPHIRFSEGAGDGDGVVYDSAQFVADRLDVGGRVSYFHPIFSGTTHIGAGFAASRRFYHRNVAGGTSDRQDTRLEGTAHLIFNNLLGDGGDLRFDYRFERNNSSDDSETFSNHVVGTRVLWRF